MDYLASIIIPVYNTEKYLKACVESVEKGSSGFNVELIIVNDGSKDNSFLICKELAIFYKNINVIDQLNMGLSEARNTGIKNAKGKYIIFIDSDDKVSDTFSDLLEVIKNNDSIDLFMCPYKRFYKDREAIEGTNPFFEEKKYYISSELIETLLTKTNNIYPAVKNIVKRDFINKNHLYFKKGILHEDVDWTLRLILNMESFFYVKNAWYLYDSTRENSIMNTIGLKSLNDVFLIFRDFVQYANNKGVSDNDLKNFNITLSKTCFSLLRYIKSMEISSKEKAEKLIKNNLDLFSYSDNTAHRMFYKISRIVGVKTTLKLVFAIKKI